MSEEPVARGRTGPDGRIQQDVPPGRYEIRILRIGGGGGGTPAGGGGTPAGGGGSGPTASGGDAGGTVIGGPLTDYGTVVPAGKELHPMRKAIIAKAIGMCGTIDAQLNPTGGWQVLQDIFRTAAPKYPNGDNEFQPGMKQPASWCGIFDLYCCIKAGATTGTWIIGKGPPFPVKFGHADIIPGDICQIPKNSHFFLITARSGDTIKTCEGNTTWRRIVQKQRDVSEVCAVFRTVPEDFVDAGSSPPPRPPGTDATGGGEPPPGGPPLAKAALDSAPKGGAPTKIKIGANGQVHVEQPPPPPPPPPNGGGGATGAPPVPPESLDKECGHTLDEDIAKLNRRELYDKGLWQGGKFVHACLDRLLKHFCEKDKIDPSAMSNVAVVGRGDAATETLGVPTWCQSWRNSVSNAPGWTDSFHQPRSRLAEAFFYTFLYQRCQGQGLKLAPSVIFLLKHLFKSNDNGRIGDSGGSGNMSCAAISNAALVRSVKERGYIVANRYWMTPNGIPKKPYLIIWKDMLDMQVLPGDILDWTGSVGPWSGHVVTIACPETTNMRSGMIWVISGNTAPGHGTVAIDYAGPVEPFPGYANSPNRDGPRPPPGHFYPWALCRTSMIMPDELDKMSPDQLAAIKIKKA